MNILDFLFPRRCLACGKLGKYFCDRCSGKIRTIEERETICPVCERPAIGGATHPFCKTRFSIDGLTSFFHYNGIIQKAIKAIKYRSVSDLSSEFVSLIPQSAFSLIPKPSVLIPIPLHPFRLRLRGFNQAEVLGKLIAPRLGIPMRTDLVKRMKYTMPQVEMKDRNKRLKNMEKVFSIHKLFIINHSSVLLFDDVFTTGATMRAAASVLKKGGAEFVWGITMAR